MRCDAVPNLLPINPVYRSQDGTDEIDEVKAIAMGDDGSAILVGYTEGVWSTTNAGYRDCVAMKLEANGTVAWTWQVNMKSCEPGLFTCPSRCLS